MSARALGAQCLLLLAWSSGCAPDAPEGVFVCQDASECPSDWACEARGAETKRCYQSGTVPIVSMDAAGIPSMSGGGQTYFPPDASDYQCGAWKRVRSSDAPPVDAEAFGREYRVEGPRDEYLCRFASNIDGKSVTIQGRAIFGMFCLATVPAGVAAPARAEPSRDFEVLTQTKTCARWVPYYETTHMLPTGSGPDGAPTFSCRAFVKSASNLPELSMYLGRFDVATRTCVYEYNGNARIAPSTDATPEEKIQVLAIPL